MSVQSVEIHDIQKVLSKMALNREPFLPRLSAQTTREYGTIPMGSRQSQRPATQLGARTSRSTSAIPTKPKHPKSMSTELYCGPCSRDSLFREAEGYCIECSEYFCTTCIKHHKNLKITKTHVVRDRKKMPKIHHHIEDEESTETCQTHPGELIRYHCPDHDESCCGVCATLNHRSCVDLAYIPAMKAKKTNKSSMKMVRHLNSLVSQFERVKKDTGRNVKQLDIQQEDFQQAVTKFHQEVFDALQSLEIAALREMNHLQSDEQGFLASRLEMCDETIKNLQQASSHLQMALQNGIESKTFLQLRKTSKEVSIYESLLGDMKMKNLKPVRFTFKPSSFIRRFIRTADNLGSIEFSQKTSKSAVLLTQFTVQSRGDSFESCDITGITVLPDGRLVLADMHNESIKLTDSSYKMTTQTKLNSPPWDICAISNDQVLVSLPRENKLQFLKIAVSIRPLKKIGNAAIANPSQFYGVCYIQSRIFVTCPKDETPNVKILDMQGKVLEQINASPQGQNLFLDPLYIAVAYNSRNIYVSDSGNNTIIHLESGADGKAETHEVPNKAPPGGLTVQPDEQVLVCGFKTNNIHQHSAEGKFLNEIISSEGGLLNPQTIAYCAKERRLIVSMQKSEMVKVFQLC